jgi:hypothetical protein
MSHDEILLTVKNYMINFLEKSHTIFSNMPVCPFAKKARTKETINYQFVFLKQMDSYLNLIIEFKYKFDESEGLFLLAEDIISNKEIESVTDILTEMFGDELQLFAFHPDSQFEMNGLHTRRMLTPGIIVQRNSDVEVKELALKKSKYYDKLTMPYCLSTANDPIFYIKEVIGKGNGLFTKIHWNASENLFALSGQVKKINESSELAIQISETECIESHPYYNDYIVNHSCDPNSKVFFGDQILMRSIRPIEPNEEITWDYETTEYDMTSCAFYCNCGSSICRGLITGCFYQNRYPAWKLVGLSR